ncbi:MAG: 6-phosphogluconolactonase, partial [Nitrospirae bacterium RBG_19FT_COMBO_55_12]
RFLALARESIASAEKFTVALSGGSTPRRLFSLLGTDPYQESVDWKRAHVFWADERAVPRDHPESNFKLAFDTFLSAVPIPTANIHRIKGEDGPDKAAKEYEDDLRSFFEIQGLPMFDLIILGIGEDGHTASLFSGSSALGETTRLALPVYPERSGTSRVTITLPVLNNAAHILFLASGHAKANIVAGVIGEGKTSGQYPAGLVNPAHGSLEWFIDKDAAAKLSLPR